MGTSTSVLLVIMFLYDLLLPIVWKTLFWIIHVEWRNSTPHILFEIEDIYFFLCEIVPTTIAFTVGIFFYSTGGGNWAESEKWRVLQI